MVSGSFHSLLKGSFHLSLTVLVHYRSQRSIEPWRVVPPVSYRISRVPHYSGYPWAIVDFAYRTLTVFGRPSQAVRLSTLDPAMGSYNPDHTCVGSVWALPGSLAATTGISFDFFSSAYLDVSIQQVCFKNLCIQLLIVED